MLHVRGSDVPFCLRWPDGWLASAERPNPGAGHHDCPGPGIHARWLSLLAAVTASEGTEASLLIEMIVSVCLVRVVVPGAQTTTAGTIISTNRENEDEA